MTLAELNRASADTLRSAFLTCCGSRVWADEMVIRCPYGDVAALRKAAEEVWCSLAKPDWLEAFAAHPKIGEKRASAKWSESEQAGMSGASETLTEAMRRMNEEYETRFGWIFIVCATGKSGEEMSSLLNARLANDANTELTIAAAEQLKITQLRLGKLITE